MKPFSFSFELFQHRRRKETRKKNHIYEFIIHQISAVFISIELCFSISLMWFAILHIIFLWNWEGGWDHTTKWVMLWQGESGKAAAAVTTQHRSDILQGDMSLYQHRHVCHVCPSVVTLRFQYISFSLTYFRLNKTTSLNLNLWHCGSTFYHFVIQNDSPPFSSTPTKDTPPQVKSSDNVRMNPTEPQSQWGCWWRL